MPVSKRANISCVLPPIGGIPAAPMSTFPSTLVVLIATLFLATFVSAAETTLADLRSRRSKAYTTYAEEIVRNPRRQYLFGVPGRADVDSTPNVRLAATLWRIADEFAAAGHIEPAYQLTHEVLHYDPSHAEARRRLGRSWQPSSTLPQNHPAQNRHRTYGWPGGTYVYVTTPHFQITSNATEEQTRRLAHELEALHTVWRQLFVRYWTTDRVFQTRWSAGTLPSPQGNHRVVLFANREEYIRQLQKHEPQIELSTGVYRDQQKSAFFYAGDPAPVATWYHEATHQLFHENGRVARSVGERQNFWIIEGIALYMESLVRHDGYATVGGVDATRLQFARYRVLEEDYYQPLPEFVSLSHDRLQLHAEIRRLYSQAAGLSHFLMDGRDGMYRPAVSKYLRAVYQRRDEPDTLAKLTGQSLADLDREYREFLAVKDEDLIDAPISQSLTALNLGRTGVTDEGLHLSQWSQLTWLNLRGCEVTDLAIARIDDDTPLRQLSLEGTRITDLSLQKIGQLTTLDELDLSATRITNDGLKELSALKNLTTLWLSNTRVSDAGLQHLRHLRRLKKLDLTNSRVTPAGLRGLRASLPNLQ